MEAASTIGDWGAALVTSVTAALSMFVAAIPRIIGFLLILLAGWFIASLVAKAVAMLLRTVRFNELSQRAGLSDFVQRMGVKSDSAGFVAAVVKWIVRLAALVVAFDALGLPAVSQVLREFLMWLPNLVVAMVVLVIGGIAAKAFSALVRGSAATARVGDPELLARVATGAVWAFTIVVAVNQLGIATTLVNALFMAAVGAVAIALGLAFGLGGRDTASEIVRNWYRRSRETSSEARDALSAASEVGAQEAGRAVGEPGEASAAESQRRGQPLPSGH